MTDLSLAPDESGVLTWHMEHASTASKKDKTLKVIYVNQPESQNALAELRNVTKGAISTQCESLRAAGYLDGDSNVTEKGVLRLRQFWPEIGSERQRQQDILI